MDLKIGGIYTESNKQLLDIIIMQRDNVYYFLQFECFANKNKEIQNVVENLLNNFELFATANVFIGFTDGESTQLSAYIDGYLGQIDEELLKKLQKKIIEIR